MAKRQAPAMDIVASTTRYEAWLKAELGPELVRDDLDAKRDAMADTPFRFLRASYWRWSETILDRCPRLGEAESVLSVGDIHLENFGTWRDADGRLAWGVNDYDEAAAMPWPLDLVRLAASAVLAGAEAAMVAPALLEGYAAGLAQPAGCVLGQQPAELRAALLSPQLEPEPGDEWWPKQLDKARKRKATPPPRWRHALLAGLPQGAEPVVMGRREAGTGSLGRPRWWVLADWRGGLVAREAKALLPSAWLLPGGRGARVARSFEAATGPYRVPDPWYAVQGQIARRWLSPENRKLEVAEGKAHALLTAPVLAAMGQEIASIQRGHAEAKPLRAALKAMPRHWLRDAAESAAEMVRGEFKAWRRHHRGA